MNLLLLSPQETSVIRILKDNPRYQHIKDVLKIQLQDELVVGQINGLIGRAKVISINREEIVLEVVCLDQRPPKPLDITLILALPRPPMVQRLLSAVTSMGIKRIYLIQTNRVEKSYWNSHVLTPEAIHEQLVLGLEQAKDTILPDVKLIKRFKPFVEDQLSEISAGSLKILAHPDVSVKPCPVHLHQSVTIVIGPEGGLVPYEVDLLLQKGFEVVHLGERILRVETAVIVLLSKVGNFCKSL